MHILQQLGSHTKVPSPRRVITIQKKKKHVALRRLIGAQIKYNLFRNYSLA